MTELERPVGDPNEARDIEPEMREDPTDLAILALLQRHGEPGIAALGALQLRADRPVGNPVERQPLLQRFEARRLDRSMNAHAIAPDPAARGKLQRPREAAVVGEEQQPFGGQVQASDRADARQLRRQALEHGRPALLVPMRGPQTPRLVVAPEPRGRSLSARACRTPPDAPDLW